MELFRDTNYDFLGKKWPFIIASLLLTVVGLGSLIVKGGPRYGIDFRGGTLVYLKFADKPPVEKLRSILGAKLGGTPEVQEITGSNEVIVGTELRSESELQQARQTIVDTLAANFGQGQTGKLDFNNASQQQVADRIRGLMLQSGANEQQVQDSVAAAVQFRNATPQSGLLRSFDQLSGVTGVAPQALTALKQDAMLAPYSIRQVEVVGPKVGAELRQQAVYVVLAALAGMLVYIAFRFEWIYGVAAVIAVFHDTIITLGMFSLLDKEITLTVVAALLTLVGYSMNDTIVTFDRIRENLHGSRRGNYAELVNASINQTLSRTVLTSGLTFLTALALWIFGGPVLNGFSLALVIGILIGTFSSIFIASPILIFWRDWREKKVRQGPGSPSAAVPSGVARRTPAKVVK